MLLQKLLRIIQYCGYIGALCFFIIPVITAASSARFAAASAFEHAVPVKNDPYAKAIAILCPGRLHASYQLLVAVIISRTDLYSSDFSILKKLTALALVSCRNIQFCPDLFHVKILILLLKILPCFLHLPLLFLSFLFPFLPLFFRFFLTFFLFQLLLKHLFLQPFPFQFFLHFFLLECLFFRLLARCPFPRLFLLRLPVSKQIKQNRRHMLAFASASGFRALTVHPYRQIFLQRHFHPINLHPCKDSAELFALLLKIPYFA